MSKWVKEASNKIETIKNNFPGYVLVGVHIRKKDYKNFLGGKYYYDYEVYKKRMEEVARLIQGQTLFIIFSDEKVEREQLINEQIYQIVISSNAAIIDMIMMSHCDYLIGPPSTFSGWSSFWGEVPKHIMVDGDTPITSLDVHNFGIYMIDIIDNKEDETGRKIITPLYASRIER